MLEKFKAYVKEIDSKANSIADNDPNSIYYDYMAASLSCYYYKAKNLLTKE